MKNNTIPFMIVLKPPGLLKQIYLNFPPFVIWSQHIQANSHLVNGHLGLEIVGLYCSVVTVNARFVFGNVAT